MLQHNPSIQAAEAENSRPPPCAVGARTGSANGSSVLPWRGTSASTWPSCSRRRGARPAQPWPGRSRCIWPTPASRSSIETISQVFERDRSTVSHARHVVEDGRDDIWLDCRLEVPRTVLPGRVCRALQQTMPELSDEGAHPRQVPRAARGGKRAARGVPFIPRTAPGCCDPPDHERDRRDQRAGERQRKPAGLAGPPQGPRRPCDDHRQPVHRRRKTARGF